MLVLVVVAFFSVLAMSVSSLVPAAVTGRISLVLAVDISSLVPLTGATRVGRLYRTLLVIPGDSRFWSIVADYCPFSACFLHELTGA